MQQQSHAQLTHLAGGYAVWQPAGAPLGSVAQLVAIPANWKLTSCPNASTAAHEHQPVNQQHVLLTMGTAPANAAASSCWPASKQGPAGPLGPGRLMQHLSSTVAAAGAGRPYPGSSYRYLDQSGSPGCLSNASSPQGYQQLPCLSAASQQLTRWVAISGGRSLQAIVDTVTESLQVLGQNALNAAALWQHCLTSCYPALLLCPATLLCCSALLPCCYPALQLQPDRHADQPTGWVH